MFARTLTNLGDVQLGFRPEKLLLFYVDPSRNGYGPEQTVAVYRRIQEGMAAVPGVADVTLAQYALLGGGVSSNSVEIPGYTPPPKEKYTTLETNWVGEGYARVMGMRLIAGRDITPGDRNGKSTAVLWNEAAANKYSGGASRAVGRQFRLNGQSMEVIGVVADAKYHSIRIATRPGAYLAYFQQKRPGSMTFMVRTAVHDPLAIASAVRRVVAEVDPTLPVAEVRTQEQQIQRTLSRERTFALLAGFFSAVAVLLSAIGLYGVLAYAVGRRTGEFGIRMALGATGGHIRWIAVRDAVWVIAAGVVAGVPAAWALARMVRSRLYNVEPWDPTSVVVAVGAMLAAGMLAAWIPSRRAAKADPATALRYE